MGQGAWPQQSGLTNRINSLGVERAISEPVEHRPTAAEMEERCEALIEIVNEVGPATVRQVFYQASVRGVISKDEARYNKVQYLLVKLRCSGEIDYDSIASTTRATRFSRRLSRSPPSLSKYRIATNCTMGPSVEKSIRAGSNDRLMSTTLLPATRTAELETSRLSIVCRVAS